MLWPTEKVEPASIRALVAPFQNSRPVQSPITVFSDKMYRELAVSYKPLQQDNKAKKTPKIKIDVEKLRKKLIKKEREQILRETDFVQLPTTPEPEQVQERPETSESYPSERRQSHYKRPTLVEPYHHVPRGHSGHYRPWRKYDKIAQEWMAGYDPSSLPDDMRVRALNDPMTMEWPVLERTVLEKKTYLPPLSQYLKPYPYPRREVQEHVMMPLDECKQKCVSQDVDMLSLQLKIVSLRHQGEDLSRSCDKALLEKDLASKRALMIKQRETNKRFRQLHGHIAQKTLGQDCKDLV
ncbi:hypothetical protein EDD86DRAFT_250469 [Gorgonomyces haynaldii]|nr:hypothetical protein EDD86DRAFT_250469 [Gorgonomyces haynaldii]